MTAPCPTCTRDFHADPTCGCGVDWAEQQEINARGKALALAHIQGRSATEATEESA